MERLRVLLLLVMLCVPIAADCYAANGDIFIQRSNPIPDSGETFTAEVVIESGSVPLGGYAMDLSFNPSVFSIVNIEGAPGFNAIR